MFKFFTTLAVTVSLFVTGFSQEISQQHVAANQSVKDYEPATIKGTLTGANILYATGGSLVVGAIAAAIIISTNNDQEMANLTN